MHVRASEEDVDIVKEALIKKDWKSLETAKQRFIYQTSLKSNDPQFWEIVNHSREILGKKPYVRRKDQENSKKKDKELKRVIKLYESKTTEELYQLKILGEKWLENNKDSKNYNFALEKYQLLQDKLLEKEVEEELSNRE